MSGDAYIREYTVWGDGRITTAARRIARAVNALADAPGRRWVLVFNENGRQYSRHELLSPGDLPRDEWEWIAGPGRRVTYREVQDELDRAASHAVFLATATYRELRAAGYTPAEIIAGDVVGDVPGEES